MAPTHMEGAAAAWLGACVVWGSPPPETVAGGTVLAVLAALAVDTDHRRSMATQALHIGGLALGLAAVLTGFAVTSPWHSTWPLFAVAGVVAGALPWLTRPPPGRGFRGWLHSRWGLALVGALGGAVWVAWPPWPAWATLAVWTGWGSHLLLDALTKEGLPWRYPDRWRLGIFPREMSMTTGGKRRKKGQRRPLALEYVMVQPVLAVVGLGALWLIARGGFQ